MFSKTLQDGRTATVAVEPHSQCVVEIDGRWFASGDVRKLDTPRGPATHAIGHGKILGLTDAEAEAIRSEHARVTAEWDASEEGQRAGLAAGQRAASGAWADARAHAANTGDWSRVMPAEAASRAADDAIGAFDAAHPELAAKIAAQREQRERENFEAGWNR